MQSQGIQNKRGAKENKKEIVEVVKLPDKETNMMYAIIQLRNYEFETGNSMASKIF